MDNNSTRFVFCVVLVVLGYISNTVKGDCTGPPTIDNPYGVIIDPVQDIYTNWSRVDLRCESGTTPSGPDYSYCDPALGDWNPDVSSFVCYATCDADDFDSDIMITPSANESQVFDHGTTVTVSCAVPGVLVGSNSGTCKNGTWDFVTFPSCAAYCLEPVAGDGLLHAPDPPINDTGYYYLNDDQITYTCDEGYEPLNCTVINCTATCEDGTWEPATTPTCSVVTTEPAMTTVSTINMTSSGGTSPAELSTNMEPTDSNTFGTVITDLTSVERITNTEDGSSPKSDLTTAYDATSVMTERMDTTMYAVITSELTTSAVNTEGRSTSTDISITTSLETTEIQTKDVTSKSKPTTEALATKSPCESCDEKTEWCPPGIIVCECRPSLYRNEPDDICTDSKSLEVSIYITHINGEPATYKKELEDDNSAEFKKLESEVCEPFNILYEESNDYRACEVIEFRNGSIAVDYNLMFNNDSTETVETVENTTRNALEAGSGNITAGNNSFSFNTTTLKVVELNECTKGLSDCHENATCIDKGASGFTCNCTDGFYDTGPKGLPGRSCVTENPTESIPTEELQTTVTSERVPTEEPQNPVTSERVPTEEPQNPETWKIIVGVTVPLVGVLSIAIIVLSCWQCRHESSKRKSNYVIGMKDMEMPPIRTEGTVEEVVLPWRDQSEEEFVFANETGVQAAQTNDYATSPYHDPLENIVNSYDNYVYKHHEGDNETINDKYF